MIFYLRFVPDQKTVYFLQPVVQLNPFEFGFGIIDAHTYQLTSDLKRPQEIERASKEMDEELIKCRDVNAKQAARTWSDGGRARRAGEAETTQVRNATRRPINGWMDRPP